MFNGEISTPKHAESPEKGETLLRKTTLPNIRFVLCEPFILPNGWVEKNTELWQTEIKKRQENVRKLADEYQAIFIPFQQHFTKACQTAPASFWIWDGVHPMPTGHELMARVWIEEVMRNL